MEMSLQSTLSDPVHRTVVSRLAFELGSSIIPPLHADSVTFNCYLTIDDEPI